MGDETLAERQLRPHVPGMFPPNPALNSVQGQGSSRGMPAPTPMPFIPDRQTEGPTEMQASKGSLLSLEVYRAATLQPFLWVLPSSPIPGPFPTGHSRGPGAHWLSCPCHSPSALDSPGLPQPRLMLPAAQAFQGSCTIANLAETRNPEIIPGLDCIYGNLVADPSRPHLPQHFPDGAQGLLWAVDLTPIPGLCS